MDKRHKDIMRTLVTRLRHVLVGRIGNGGFEPGNLDRELERLGVAPDGTITAADSLSDKLNGERRVHNIAVAQLGKLALTQRLVMRNEIIERAAYTWINRLLALRAMEVRGLIRDTLRGNDEDYGGFSEKLYFILKDQAQRAVGDDKGWWAVIEDACNEQAKSLPGLFALDDPTAALKPGPAALVQCAELMNGTQSFLPGVTLDELDETFKDPDAIGWAYQFYQEEAKAAIDAKCKSGGKAATRAEIAAKTQLFTEPYMVQWLLQNSLGRSYMEAYPQSKLSSGWAYYITPEQNNTVVESKPPFKLEELTLIDPCMGSGHFLREAFDMFVAMYREQQPHLTAKEIADILLSKHLYGIDLDPRATQLAQLTLYLRAWELVREEQRRQRKPNLGYIPPTLNLAMTPMGLDKGALERHLERNPQDEVLRELLEGIFQGLEQADTLGSLLRAREYLDSGIEKLQKPHTIQMDFDPETAQFRHDVTELAKHDPVKLKQILLDRVANSFHAETMNKDDVSAELFAYEAERGVRLLQVLDKQYAVVVTNPPYLGSKSMDSALKRYVEKHYSSGKRDLYATFILRCLDLCLPNGRVAMITQHSWMFLGSFIGIRQKLITEAKLSTIAHLGTKTFKDLSNTNALGFVLFTIHYQVTLLDDEVICFRLVHAQTKEALLRTITMSFNKEGDDKTLSFKVLNKVFQKFPGNALFYWSPKGITEAFLEKYTLSLFIEAKQGLITGDNNRFLRFWWEVNDDRWKPYSKGGPFRRWFGNQELVVNWHEDGIRIKDFKTSTGRQKSRPQNISYYFREGGTWTGQSSYGFSVRYLPKGFIFDAKGPSFFLKMDNIRLSTIIALANSKVIQFVFSAIQPTIDYGEGYFMSLPAPSIASSKKLISNLGEIAITLKMIQTKNVITERYFFARKEQKQTYFAIDSIIHTIEGFNDKVICDAYNLTEEDANVIMTEAGISAGWYPFITNYDIIPTLPCDINLSSISQELLEHLTFHKHVNPSLQELANIKENLRKLYEAGHKVKDAEQEDNTEDDIFEDDGEEEREIVTETHISIPTETFLEELSVKMQLHPISVYWLLEELRAEGVHCKPEEQHFLEDRLSVIVLRLLGHRWPKQIEVWETVPEWAIDDGIIPLVTGTGAKTLEELVRERLSVEDGALETQKTERLIEELTGQNLQQWLRSTFFTRHITQFKHRPIAWHLASTPLQGKNENGKKKRSGTEQRRPLFECILYYHACAGDALARVRTQYVEPLLQSERGKINIDTLFAEDPASATALEHIRELEAFAEKLRTVEDHGFTCPELVQLISNETLDRWSGDGYSRPQDQQELLHNEEAWHVDINDGVRVNIAPLQLAGVLAKDVLNNKNKDAKKAIADRARWRADERRWVREGKLPRCGWMDERVPGSPEWKERAPIRMAEQEKLEQKRLALQTE